MICLLFCWYCLFVLFVLFGVLVVVFADCFSAGCIDYLFDCGLAVCLFVLWCWVICLDLVTL